MRDIKRFGLHGIIDEVRIYNRALAPEEIRAHYLAGKSRYSRSIVVSDKFRIFNTSLSELLRLTTTDLNLNVSLLPISDNTYDLGSSSYRWKNIYAVNLYGTAHYADVYFQDLVCPLCHKRFKEHDKLVLIVTKVSDKEIRCLPAHLECDS